MKTLHIPRVGNAVLAVMACALLTAIFTGLVDNISSPQIALAQSELDLKTSTQRLYRDGSNNLEYVCTAFTRSSDTRWLLNGGVTSIVDSANTSTVTTVAAHGLAVGNRVAFERITSDADLTASYYVQTVGSTTTFTVTTANVTDATYNSSSDPNGLITTTAPLGTKPVWQIQKMYYTGTYLDRVTYSDRSSICDDRATTTGATKVTYN